MGPIPRPRVDRSVLSSCSVCSSLCVRSLDPPRLPASVAVIFDILISTAGRFPDSEFDLAGNLAMRTWPRFAVALDRGPVTVLEFTFGF